MKIHYALRVLFAAAIAALPLQSAFAEGEAPKKESAAPAAAAKPADAPAEKKSDVPPIKLETEQDKFSYLVGADIGTNFKRNGIKVERSQFVAGCSDVMQGKQPAMTDEEMSSVLQKLREKLMAAQGNPEAKPLEGDDAFLKQLSYVLGADIGTDLKRSQLEIKVEPFVRAIEDVVGNQTMAMTQDEMKVILDGYKQKQMEKMKVAAEKNLADGQAFLAENEKKPGVKKTASGLQYLVVTEGKGEMPKATDTVRTHYRGTLIDGTEFDSSYSRNEPTEFPVNGVIPGWTEALQLMKVGDKWKLFIPAELAYGERGAGGDIGPNSTLVFDIELLEIVKAQEAPSSDGTISLDAGATPAEKKTN